MKLRDYVKLGVNHHLLYADSITSAETHLETMKKLLEDPRLEIVDLWTPREVAKEAAEAIRKSGKTIYYNIGQRKGEPKLETASMDESARKRSLGQYLDELARAKECNAEKIITNSGPNDPANRDECKRFLHEFYLAFCKEASPCMVIIEPTDWDMSKCKLIGSSAEAAEVCRKVRAAGLANMGSMIDMCHVPLMHEDLLQAVEGTGEYLEHIHLGNCILDKSNPKFGDKHPGFGAEGGVYGLEALAEIFYMGLKTGYFRKEQRGSASIEMRVLPGKTPEECLDIYYNAVCEAWEMAAARFQQEQK